MAFGVIGALMSRAGKFGKKAAASLGGNKASKSDMQSFLSGDEFMGPGAAYKDFTGGNPLHYQTHCKPRKDTTKRSTKVTLHHRKK